MEKILPAWDGTLSWAWFLQSIAGTVAGILLALTLWAAVYLLFEWIDKKPKCN